MDMDEMENGMRVRIAAWGLDGTIRLLTDTVEVHLDDGTDFEVSGFGGAGDRVVPPEYLEPVSQGTGKA